MTRPPLRVALFTGNYNYTRDGATQALTRLVDHLRDAVGAEVRIYSPTNPASAEETPEALISIPSVGIPGRPEYRLALGLTPAARQDVLAFDPDIVHLSTPDILGTQAQKLFRQRQTPVISSLHTRFETYLSYYGLGWLEPLLEQSIKTFYQRSDFVLVPTQAIADEFEADGMEGRVRIWSRGVDRRQFDPARRDLGWRRSLGLADEDFVVLFFGRVVLEKGLGAFADTLQRLAAVEPRTRALVVGDGPARGWLAERLPDAVFAGFLHGEELGRAVASADALLHPSTTEAFSNVTLEAMASGLPIVCADVAANRNLARDGVSALMCPADDIEAYAAALGRLARDPELRADLGSAAREASADFSWTAALERVVDVYQEAMARHQRPGDRFIRALQPASE